jgi:hypothetical protein
VVAARQGSVSNMHAHAPESPDGPIHDLHPFTLAVSLVLCQLTSVHACVYFSTFCSSKLRLHSSPIPLSNLTCTRCDPHHLPPPRVVCSRLPPHSRCPLCPPLSLLPPLTCPVRRLWRSQTCLSSLFLASRPLDWRTASSPPLLTPTPTCASSFSTDSECAWRNGCLVYGCSLHRTLPRLRASHSLLSRTIAMDRVPPRT